jgi:hypothetical protein
LAQLALAIVMPLDGGLVLVQLSNEMNRKLSLDMSFLVNSFKYWKNSWPLAFLISNDWQTSQHKVGQIIPKRLGNKKCTMI